MDVYRRTTQNAMLTLRRNKELICTIDSNEQILKHENCLFPTSL